MVDKVKPVASCWVLPVIAVLLLGCDTPVPDGQAVLPVVVDQEAIRQELLEQDLLFSDTVKREGVAEAYRQFMGADAVQLPDGGTAIGGREEIYQELRALTTGSDFELYWEPLDAQVAASGELGYTWGIYYFESLDELGAPFVAEGKYVYLWQKNNGRWELILDITNQTEPDYIDESSDYDDYADWNEEAGLAPLAEDAQDGANVVPEDTGDF